MRTRKLSDYQFVDAIFDGSGNFPTYLPNEYPLNSAVELTSFVNINGKLKMFTVLAQVTAHYQVNFDRFQSRWLYNIHFVICDAIAYSLEDLFLSSGYSPSTFF